MKEEMIPYIHDALAGSTTYSKEIVDTTWGHIFTACYPVQASDGSGEIVGALCMEMDMDDTYAFLEQSNRTTFVQDGQQAVDAFQRNPAGTYDAILMDVMMPVMDGMAATRTIRALDRPDAKDIPIIAMTANAFMEDAEKCFAAGMTAHLAKPLEIRKMVSVISQYCKGERV